MKYPLELGETVVDFLETLPSAGSAFISFREAIDAMKSGKHKREQRSFVRDLVEIMEYLEPADRARFVEFAASRGIIYSSAKYVRNVERILKRKSLSTLEQYEQLREFVERSWDDAQHEERVAIAESLLSEYEKQRGR